MIFRSLSEKETDLALKLAWNVFLEFEAPDYNREGVDEFYMSIHDPEFVRKLFFYGAFEGEDLVGVLATCSGGEHITLFFVKGEMQGQGIGRTLFELAQAKNTSGIMTVNSSPYAVGIYRHFGFAGISSEQITNGIRYTPMELCLWT